MSKRGCLQAFCNLFFITGAVLGTSAYVYTKLSPAPSIMPKDTSDKYPIVAEYTPTTFDTPFVQPVPSNIPIILTPPSAFEQSTLSEEAFNRQQDQVYIRGLVYANAVTGYCNDITENVQNGGFIELKPVRDTINAIKGMDKGTLFTDIPTEQITVDALPKKIKSNTHFVPTSNKDINFKQAVQTELNEQEINTSITRLEAILPLRNTALQRGATGEMIADVDEHYMITRCIAELNVNMEGTSLTVDQTLEFFRTLQENAKS